MGSAHPKHIDPLFYDLFQQSPALILVLERDGRIVEANQRSLVLLGFTRAELLELKGEDLLPLEALAAVRNAVHLAADAEQPSELDSTLSRAHGEPLPVRMKVKRLDTDSGSLLQLTAQATGDHLEHTEQRQLAQRMEAIGRLAGGVAHDFNNLLTVIGMHLDYLDGHLDDPVLRREIELSQGAAAKAASLTHQLLAFSRQQFLRPRVLDLNPLVVELCGMLRRLIGEKLELVVDLASDLGRIEADPAQLEQVLMNLTLNSRDALPDGGRITISTANVDVHMRDRETPAVLEIGRYVLVTVSDNGSGMDKATAARIFEPFFTTKRSTKGTGLGLSMVYGIVKQSGGYIFVDSRPQQGTTFRIYLPRVFAEATATKQPRLSASARHGDETVLVVEDDGSLRSVIVTVLSEAGYSVLEADDGARALAAFANARDRGIDIDLMLTDVVLPRMSCADLLAQLEPERAAGLQVVLMSGYSTEEASELDPELPYLAKPFSADGLNDLLRAVLDAPGDSDS